MKKVYSLFIGRWQPFHPGHKAMIETALERGKNVLIALRDTEINKNNPYTVEERMATIREAMLKWGDRVLVVAIPDIDEVCYGRKVGYEIKEIHLPKSIEEISGTKIRNNAKIKERFDRRSNIREHC